MHRLLLATLAAFLLAGCSGGGDDHPKPRPPATRTVYYLTTAAQLGDRPADYYAAHGVVPIVLLPGNGTNLFTPGWGWEKSVGAIRSRVSGPLYVALWCDNVQRDEQPDGSSLAPWDDDAGWETILANLRALRAACERHQVSGVVFDGEIYTATKDNNGGTMGAGAWPSGARAKERGKQFRSDLGSLTVGQYVLVSDAKRLPGWSAFWGAVYRKNDLLLDESGYLGSARATAFEERVRNLPGRTIRGGQFRGEAPRGSFWVYPWDGSADLSRFSPLWSR